MKSITTRLFPYAGDVLLSDQDAIRRYREAFYHVLITEVGEDLRLLVDSCRPELSQIDFTPWAFAPEPPWLAIMAPVQPVVEAWARARNLNVDWLIEDLLLALVDTDGGLLPLVVESRLQAEERPPFMRVSVSVENWWHYSAMPRWAMRELLIDSCTKHIDAELDRIEQELEVAGVVKREGKRETKGTEKQRGADPSRHFRWLVRYQVLKEGYSEIAKTTKPRVDRGTVKEAVQKTAKLIGLPLRPPDPPGAPPASGNR